MSEEKKRWSATQIAQWLSSLGFPPVLAETFERHEVDGEVFFGDAINMRTLRSELEISSFGIRVKLMMARAVAIENENGTMAKESNIQDKSSLPITQFKEPEQPIKKKRTSSINKKNNTVSVKKIKQVNNQVSTPNHPVTKGKIKKQKSPDVCEDDPKTDIVSSAIQDSSNVMASCEKGEIPSNSNEAEVIEESIELEPEMMRILTPFLRPDLPQIKDLDLEYLHKWLGFPSSDKLSNTNFDEKCEKICKLLEDYCHSCPSHDKYPIKQILIARLATLSPEITIKDIVCYLDVKEANYFRFQSHILKIIMKKLGLSAFFVKHYPLESLEQLTSADQLEQALDKHIKPAVQEYYNLMNEFFETIL